MVAMIAMSASEQKTAPGHINTNGWKMQGNFRLFQRLIMDRIAIFKAPEE